MLKYIIPIALLVLYLVLRFLASRCFDDDDKDMFWYDSQR